MLAPTGDEKSVSTLLRMRADTEIRTAGDWTPIVIAARGGHHRTVAVLAEAAADPNVITKDGMSALMYAAVNGHLKAVQALLECKADAQLRDQSGATALTIATSCDCDDKQEILQQLLKVTCPKSDHVRKSMQKAGYSMKVQSEGSALQCSMLPNYTA